MLLDLLALAGHLGSQYKQQQQQQYSQQFNYYPATLDQMEFLQATTLQHQRQTRASNPSHHHHHQPLDLSTRSSQENSSQQLARLTSNHKDSLDLINYATSAQEVNKNNNNTNNDPSGTQQSKFQSISITSSTPQLNSLCRRSSCSTSTTTSTCSVSPSSDGTGNGSGSLEHQLLVAAAAAAAAATGHLDHKHQVIDSTSQVSTRDHDQEISSSSGAQRLASVGVNSKSSGIQRAARRTANGSTSGAKTKAPRSHLCTHCNRSFSRSDMLTRHSRLHTGLKPYQCSKCLQVFSRSDHLSTHERTHTGEKPYQCKHCAYSACRRDMITRHMRTHESESTGGNVQSEQPSGRRREEHRLRKLKSAAILAPTHQVDGR